MPEALGLVEIQGLSLSLVALDAMEKAAAIRLLEVELNDQLGALVKFTGTAAAVRAAAEAAEQIGARMLPDDPRAVVAHVNLAPSDQTMRATVVGREFNPLLEADVVYLPGVARGRGPQTSSDRSQPVNGNFALGLIETQGLTAVLEALDAAAKAGNVEVVGREKLGGGYVTVIIRGDTAAVRAAIDAGRKRVEELSLGKVIATHVIARPSEAVLSLLPKA